MKFIRKLLLLALIIIVAAGAFYLVPTRYLNVKASYQYPNMPNGCEVTALEMLMNYEGFDVSNETLEAYLAKSSYSNGDPNKAYIGSPYSKGGFYCYPGPLASCANAYFSAQGVSRQAKDITGTNPFGILNYVIFKKKPVAVWYTLDDQAPAYSERTYRNSSGQEENFYKNLHCVVVNGVDKGKVSIVDPIKGYRRVSFLEFANLYMRMGQRALVLE